MADAISALATENVVNTLERWRNVYAQLVEARRLREPNSPRAFRVNVLCIIDTSGSMAGKRINALKIALCSLVSELDASDRVALVAFNSVVQDLSGGFLSPTDLGPMLPGLLTGMRAEGSTAFYDAILTGLVQLGPAVGRPAGTTGPEKTILLCLTDGEDTCSRANIADVVAKLRIPSSIENFQMMTVTVDLEAHVLTTLEPLFVYAHAKRIDVTVRTGRRLIGVFGETVILRIVRDVEEGDFSYFQQARGMILRDGYAEMNPQSGEAPPAYSRAVHSGGSDDHDEDADASSADELDAPDSAMVRSYSPLMMRCASDDDLSYRSHSPDAPSLVQSGDPMAGVLLRRSSTDSYDSHEN